MFLLAGELCRAVLERGWASRGCPKGLVVPSLCCRRGLWVGSALHQVDAAHSSAQNCSCSQGCRARVLPGLDGKNKQRESLPFSPPYPVTLQSLLPLFALAQQRGASGA